MNSTEPGALYLESVCKRFETLSIARGKPADVRPEGSNAWSIRWRIEILRCPC